MASTTWIAETRMHLFFVALIAFSLSFSAFSQTYVVGSVIGGAIPDNIPGTAANLGSPWAIARDQAENTLVTLHHYHSVLRLNAEGVLTRVAGTGIPGYNGDSGPAESIQIGSPTGIAVDSVGDIYVADSGNCRIVKVSEGMVTTVLPGVCGSSGLASDKLGNVYVAATSQHRILLISKGAVTTVAGTGVGGRAGDGGPAASAQLNSPSGVSVGDSGEIYIADSGNHRIRKVSNAIITTVAGADEEGSDGDGGPAIDARLTWPGAVALSTTGDIYISDVYRIRKVSNGIITTVAGGGSAFPGDGGLATAASIYNANGIVVDPNGDFYFAEDGHYRIRKVSNGVITTVAGGGAPLEADGSGSLAQIDQPMDLAVDASGTLFISDSNNHRLRALVGGRTFSLAGDGIAGFTGDGAATSAHLYFPAGVAAGPDGVVYLADSYNNRIRRVANGRITTVAGTGDSGHTGDGGPALLATFSHPYDVALSPNGDLYISEVYNHCVRKISNGIISTVAGTGSPGFSGDNGPATSAQLNEPRGIAVDSTGNVYVADFRNRRIRKISGGIVTTVAGNSSYGFDGDDGPATSATLTEPQDVAVDSDGNLYISDLENHRIRKVSNGVISTIAGGGAGRGETGPATDANLITVTGVAVDANGRVYSSDQGSNRVRILFPSGPSCSASATGTMFNAATSGEILHITVVSAPACAWAVQNLPDWISYPGPPIGLGPATISLNVTKNGGWPRTASVSIAGKDVTIRQSCSNCVTADSVSPVSGSGFSQTFTLQASSTAGAADISTAWVWFSASFSSSAASSCMLYYNRPLNQVYLLNDAGTVWMPAIPGSSGALSNRQCSVTMSGVSVTPGANTLTLRLPMTFTAAFGGAKNIYLFASDSVADSSWQTRGTWSVPVVTVTADSVSPSSGSGGSQTFVLQYSDSLGAADLSTVWVWFNASFSSSAANSCMLYYNRPANQLYLLNDAGTAWTPATLGTGATLSNHQCAVDLSGVTATPGGNTLTLQLPVTFTAAFGGGKNVYLYAGGSLNSDWQTKGAWIVPVITPAVTADSVSPASGSGTSQTFSLQYSDSLGAADLSTAWVWFNASFSSGAASSCMLYYNRPLSQLFLLNDAGTAWTPATPGANTSLGNHQCAVDLSGVTATPSGNTLTLQFPMTFTSAFGGIKNVYLYAGGSLNSGWQTGGTWTVPVVTVAADSLSPSTGSGASQTFSLQYSDSLGAADLSTVWVWFNASFSSSGVNSCMLYYNRPLNQLYLLNDAGTAWSPATPGANTRLDNRQCAVDLRGVTITPSGNALTLELPMTFTSAFSGAKNVFLYAGGETLNSGWQTRGSWTVPAIAAAVTADSVAPSSGSGGGQSFTLQYSDTLGLADLSTVWVWFSASFSSSAANSCMLYYSRPLNQLYLINDAGTGWIPGTPGTAATLSNRECAVDLSGVTITPAGNTLTLQLPMTFTAPFGGSKNVYMYAGGGSLNSGWQTRGAWTVQ